MSEQGPCDEAAGASRMPSRSRRADNPDPTQDTPPGSSLLGDSYVPENSREQTRIPRSLLITQPPF